MAAKGKLSADRPDAAVILKECAECSGKIYVRVFLEEDASVQNVVKHSFLCNKCSQDQVSKQGQDNDASRKRKASGGTKRKSSSPKKLKQSGFVQPKTEPLETNQTDTNKAGPSPSTRRRMKLEEGNISQQPSNKNGESAEETENDGDKEGQEEGEKEDETVEINLEKEVEEVSGGREDSNEEIKEVMGPFHIIPASGLSGHLFATPDEDDDPVVGQVQSLLKVLTSNRQAQKINIHLSEIRRRMSDPEKMNIRTLMHYLRKSKGTGTAPELRRFVQSHNLPLHSRSGILTCFTKITEDDMTGLVGDFLLLCARHLPTLEIAKDNASKCLTEKEKEERGADLETTLRVLSQTRDQLEENCETLNNVTHGGMGLMLGVITVIQEMLAYERNELASNSLNNAL